jgi:hypothetical protein
MNNFQKELEAIINRYSMENGSNTPDFMLAEYLVECLVAYNNITKKREKWYGRGPIEVPKEAAPR